MQTDDLINDLSSELQRVPRYAADRRLGLHLGVGAIASFIAMLLILGVRPDIADASRTAPFWLKWIYTFVLSTGAFVCVRRLANPIGRLGLVWLWIAAPFAMVVVGALWELAHTPAGLVHQDMFGHTAARCAISISLLSVPILLALVIAFASLRPRDCALPASPLVLRPHRSQPPSTRLLAPKRPSPSWRFGTAQGLWRRRLSDGSRRRV